LSEKNCPKCGSELEVVNDTTYNEFGLPQFEGCRDSYTRCPNCDAKTCPKCGAKMTFVHRYSYDETVDLSEPDHYNKCEKCGYSDR